MEMHRDLYIETDKSSAAPLDRVKSAVNLEERRVQCDKSDDEPLGRSEPQPPLKITADRRGSELRAAKEMRHKPQR